MRLGRWAAHPRAWQKALAAKKIDISGVTLAPGEAATLLKP
jgi:hypothetical protein